MSHPANLVVTEPIASPPAPDEAPDNLSLLQPLDHFAPRHIGSQGAAVEKMLDVLGVTSLDELIDQTVPATIRFQGELNLEPPRSESAVPARSAIPSGHVGAALARPRRPGGCAR